MNLSSYPQEIQNYIREINQRREETGSLDYDSCQRILKYAEEQNADALFGVGYFFLAEYYREQKNEEELLQCLVNCENSFRNASLFKYLPRVYVMMGDAFDSPYNHQIALSYYYTSIQYAKLYKDPYARVVCDIKIAYILVRMRRYKEATVHYNSAITCFEQSEDALLRAEKWLTCMVYCGSCYLMFDENEKAVELWEKVQEVMGTYPDYEYDVLGKMVLEMGCQYIWGNWGAVERLSKTLEERLYQDPDATQFWEIVVLMAEMMVRTKYYSELFHLYDVLNEIRPDQTDVLCFDLYPFIKECLQEAGKKEEYVAYTRRYLTLYQKYLRNNLMVGASILELRDRVNQVELEEKDTREYNLKLETIARYDSMTGLANRGYLHDYLSEKFEEAYLNQVPLGVELMDIDHFKGYNDTYGHLQGDVCLKAVAGVLREAETKNVFAARYGGDEFMLVYSNMTVREIREVAEKIQNGVRALKFYPEGKEKGVQITVSQGIFVKTPDAMNREWDFNSMADTALYEAKGHGRNRYHICTDFME